MIVSPIIVTQIKTKTSVKSVVFLMATRIIAPVPRLRPGRPFSEFRRLLGQRMAAPALQPIDVFTAESTLASRSAWANSRPETGKDCCDELGRAFGVNTQTEDPREPISGLLGIVPSGKWDEVSSWIRGVVFSD
jgi:hypothetical protein